MALPQDQNEEYSYQWGLPPYDTPERRAGAPQWLKDKYPAAPQSPVPPVPPPQQPSVPPQGWSYQPQGWPYPPQPVLPTEGFAIASMVLGILWVWWVGSILAVIFGHIAINRINQTGRQGRGMAIAGLVLGYIGVAALVVFIIAVIGGAAAHSGSGS